MWYYLFVHVSACVHSCVCAHTCVHILICFDSTSRASLFMSVGFIMVSIGGPLGFIYLSEETALSKTLPKTLVKSKSPPIFCLVIPLGFEDQKSQKPSQCWLVWLWLPSHTPNNISLWDTLSPLAAGSLLWLMSTQKPQAGLVRWLSNWKHIFVLAEDPGLIPSTIWWLTNCLWLQFHWVCCPLLS